MGLFPELKPVLIIDICQDVFKQIIAISSNCKQKTKGQSLRHFVVVETKKKLSKISN